MTVCVDPSSRHFSTVDFTYNNIILECKCLHMYRKYILHYIFSAIVRDDSILWVCTQCIAVSRSSPLCRPEGPVESLSVPTGPSGSGSGSQTSPVTVESTIQLVISQSYRQYTVLASRSVSPIRMAPTIRPFLNTTFTYSSPAHYIM